MSKHKLDNDEMKEIAHFITKRSINGDSGISALEINKATNQYLETYNEVLNKLEKYNDTID